MKKDKYMDSKDDSTTRIGIPCKGCGYHQTIAGALLKSNEWKEWYKYNQKYMINDVDETMTIDAMSNCHWKNFIAFIKK